MTADWAALEQRVAELEQVTSQASSGLDAILVKIGLILRDLEETRVMLDERGHQLARMRGEMTNDGAGTQPGARRPL